MHIKHTVSERFLRYVTIDTQSDPESNSYPSTEKQKNLGKLLVKELLEMGIADAHIDDFGYVYATIPSTTNKEVPVICWCSHMDTSPDCSGKDVKPLIHKNYQGQDIVLPADNTQIIRSKDHPELLNQIGNDIITADGTTLLGADNKAGVAEIMDAAFHLMEHPELKHGTIRILFTPDEEIGRGVDKVDMKKLNASFGYTIDGETIGHLEDETFHADAASLVITGVSTHPGFAKNKMQSAIKIASDIVSSLPKHTHSPETTEGKEPFIHPTSINGLIEQTVVKFILRAFTLDELEQMKQVLKSTIEKCMLSYPDSTYTLNITEQYRNMKLVLDKHPEVTSFALEAIRRAGLNPVQSSIRGGTDGSRLSFMGLPCPNIFAGEHAFHSKHEWVSIQDMHKAVETLVHLALIWEEKS
jgi:tripeptide aminopeptidase